MSLRNAALVSTIVAAFALGSCATAPRASLYTLNGTEPVPAGDLSSLVLAIGPVDLPQYLDRPHIVTRLSTLR